MEILDVSVRIRGGMLHYPGDPEIRMRRVRDIGAGDSANVSELCLGAHTGTHVDAPVHFLEGTEGADALPLASLVGEAEVVDATGLPVGPIGEAALRGLELPDGCRRLLLKTRNSELWERDEFVDEFLSLDASGARYVVDRGLVLVGIDYLSIGDEDAHRVLLSSGVVPVEGLDLRGVAPGSYTLACLPLALVGCDGAPARAVLIRDGSPAA
jgi:arylformamidase